jgi:hypothetical protein
VLKLGEHECQPQGSHVGGFDTEGTCAACHAKVWVQFLVCMFAVVLLRQDGCLWWDCQCFFQSVVSSLSA